ncbi:WhiB family transcriptional regulator [Streptomyces sp. NPDC051987]|uniref:WhiB family transcriptional regulator n=1 Tax=Streptomyces sp. NPDC051987 TaxID=3155808 RepID=UPI00344969DE
MTVDNALSWAQYAACRGLDLEEFFTEARTGMRQAKRVCAVCPVRRSCLAEALQAEDGSARYGIFGGLTAAERTALMKRKRRKEASAPAQPKKPRQPAKCGTRPGYQKHLRERTEICEPCRQANTDADNRLRRTGTTKVTR